MATASETDDYCVLPGLKTALKEGIRVRRVANGAFNNINIIDGKHDVVLVDPISRMVSVDTLQSACYRELFPTCDSLKCDVLLRSSASFSNIIVCTIQKRLGATVDDLTMKVMEQQGLDVEAITLTACTAMKDVFRHSKCMFDEHKLLHLDPSPSNVMVDHRNGVFRFIDRWVPLNAPVSNKMTTPIVATPTVPLRATEGFSLQVLARLFVHMLCKGCEFDSDLISQSHARVKWFCDRSGISFRTHLFETPDYVQAGQMLIDMLKVSKPKWMSFYTETSSLMLAIHNHHPFLRCAALSDDLVIMLQLMLSGNATFEAVEGSAFMDYLLTKGAEIDTHMRGWLRTSATTLMSAIVDSSDKWMPLKYARVVPRVAHITLDTTNVSEAFSHIAFPLSLDIRVVQSTFEIDMVHLPKKDLVPFYVMSFVGGMFHMLMPHIDRSMCEAFAMANISANQCDAFGAEDKLFKCTAIPLAMEMMNDMVSAMVQLWSSVTKALQADSPRLAIAELLRIAPDVNPESMCDKLRVPK